MRLGRTLGKITILNFERAPNEQMVERRDGYFQRGKIIYRGCRV